MLRHFTSQKAFVNLPDFEISRGLTNIAQELWRLVARSIPTLGATQLPQSAPPMRKF